MFGITHPWDAVAPGETQHVTYRKDLSSIILTGKDGYIYLFLFEKLDESTLMMKFHATPMPKHRRLPASMPALPSRTRMNLQARSHLETSGAAESHLLWWPWKKRNIRSGHLDGW